ncbi:MAG: YdjY domain-containing protein [Luteolibacter sp.]|uniref:YdjY domain-containing protein n=1 Tax=Luteolibacter sp. TaxID=1962973 RepID=UPI003266207A
MFPRLLVFSFALAAMAVAEEDAPVEKPAPVEPVKPSVKQLDETNFQIGEVTFDKKSREIRFPTKVNMIEGQLEYLIVHENGKVHESLLSTTISPTHLNLAFTLLRYPPSRELYTVGENDEGKPAKLPDVPAEVKAGARVNIDVEWMDNGKVRRIPVNEWIQHGVKETAMPAGPWVYGGSSFGEGKYFPETTGDVAAIFLSNAAILNYPGDDRDNDDVWTPFPKRVPAEGTNVTVIIAPFQKTKPPTKP